MIGTSRLEVGAEVLELDLDKWAGDGVKWSEDVRCAGRVSGAANVHFGLKQCCCCRVIVNIGTVPQS